MSHPPRTRLRPSPSRFRPLRCEHLESRLPLSGQLLTDINPTPVGVQVRGSQSQEENAIVGVGGTAYFADHDALNYRVNLWKSDGSTGGTKLIKSWAEGSSALEISELTNANGWLYFTYLDGRFNDSRDVSELGLWKTDGTAGGTVRIKEPFIGEQQVIYPSSLTNAGGMLFFSAGDGTTGSELWITDGTPAGTRLVKDINPGPLGSRPTELCAVNGTIYFRANDGAHGFELWKSDGTAAGTVMVSDINFTSPSTSTSIGSYPSQITSVGDLVYFSAIDTDQHGENLWKSDGTATGTVMVNTPAVAYLGIEPRQLTNVNGTLYFTANDGWHGFEVWKSNGTQSGTQLVKDIRTNWWASSQPIELTNLNGTLIFVAREADSYDLWKTDGTDSGTVLLKATQTIPNVIIPAPQHLTVINQAIFFNFYDTAVGSQLWKSDGTVGGTALVKQIGPYPYGSNPSGLANINGRLFFRANDETQGGELWTSDGTAAGTVVVPRDTSSTASSLVRDLTVIDNYAYFVATSGNTGEELWKTDGTAAGTSLVKDINPGPVGSRPTGLTRFGNLLIFTADDGMHGRELWKSDGTAAGTTLVLDIYNDSIFAANAPAPNCCTVLGTQFFFFADDKVHGNELWKSDGTPAGTMMVMDLQPGPNGALFSEMTVAGGNLFILAHGELWKSDGTAEGTLQVESSHILEISGFQHYLTNVSGKLFFSGSDNWYYPRRELWQSDGTVAGTTPVKKISVQGDAKVSGLTNVGGMLYFSADDTSPGIFGDFHGSELWKSDGTAAGTVMVKDIVPGNDGSRPTYLTDVNGILFFVVNDKSLWKSNGSAAGTVLVKNFTPGFGFPTCLSSINGRLVFNVNDGASGGELWTSDGTPLGTYPLADIAPGTVSSSPTKAVPLGGRILVAADDGIHGSELWSVTSSRPNFLVGPDQFVTVKSGSRSVRDWATFISGGELPATSLQFVVTNSNPTLFTKQPVINSAGLLSYAIAPGLTEPAVVSITVLLKATASNGTVELSPWQQTFTISVALRSPWHNELRPTDVDGDTRTAPGDALYIINHINEYGSGQVPPGAAFGRPYYDADDDGYVSPGDALLIIHNINSYTAAEGEWTPQTDGYLTSERWIQALGLSYSQFGNWPIPRPRRKSV